MHSTLRLFLLSLPIVLAPARATPVLGGSVVADLTANFNALDRFQPLGTSYSENGISFASPTNFAVVNGSFADVLFGGGGNPNGYQDGNALRVINQGWVAISTPGFLMSGVSFRYGMDWNFYTIEYGLMDTTFGWQALLGGAVVGSGAVTYDREHRNHGGQSFSITDSTGPGFDTLLIRSTAVAYEGIFQTTPQPPGYWYYERGAVIGYGDANHIAFDNVRVDLGERIPDGGSSLLLASLALVGLAVVSRRMS